MVLLAACCAACGLSAVGTYAGDATLDRTGDASDAVLAEGGASDVIEGAIGDAGVDADIGDACDDAGCLPIVLSRGHVSPVGIAVNGVRLFWSVDSASAKAVVACDLPACSLPVAIATDQPRTVIVAADATSVFWARDTGVRRCPIAGCAGAPLVVANGTDTNGLFVRAGRVFWTDFLSSGTVGAADALGTNAVTLASSQSFPRRIATNATHAYWTNYGTGTIMRSAVTIGPPSPFVTGQTDPWDITIDATNIYWTNRAAGTVMRCPVSGCGAGPTTLATGQLDPYAITTDAQFVYWTNRGATQPTDPSIMKMRKP